MGETSKQGSGFDIACAKGLAGVGHGFFGHSGGCHQFGYGGEGNPNRIATAREQAADNIVAGAALVAPHQTHSPDVVIVTEAWGDSPTGRPEADALVTDRRGLALGIVTADCSPVLFADMQAGVIGAAHAGWRGARAGVLEKTISAMQTLGAESSRISAAIGPTIAQESYEVDGGFREHFTADDSRFFRSGRDGHWQFDLPAYVHARLMQAGIARIDDLALDTYGLENRYYSYRRATHRGEPNYGRQLSLIALN